MTVVDLIAFVAFSIVAILFVAHCLLKSWARKTFGRCPWVPTLGDSSKRCVEEAGHVGVCRNASGRQFYGVNYTTGHTYVQFLPAPLGDKAERDELVGWHPEAAA